uniref:Transmembrane protein n=1 Tax=Acrobeloides nanus TaxID=290746 RepID=A0A914DMC4_9BILA
MLMWIANYLLYNFQKLKIQLNIKATKIGQICMQHLTNIQRHAIYLFQAYAASYYQYYQSYWGTQISIFRLLKNLNLYLN